MSYIGNNPKLKSIVSTGDTLANLTAESRQDGRLVYATDTSLFYLDDGSGLIALTSRKDNLAATVDPVVGDDVNDGYEAGSLWYNQTNDTLFVCEDASAGAAVWQAATGAVPSEISLNAFKTANGTGVTGTQTAVFDNNNVLNGNISYNNTTGTITFNEAGRYFLSYNLYLNVTVSASNVQSWISSSGTFYGNYYFGGITTDTYSMKGTAIIDASAAQTAVVQYFIASGGTVVLNGASGPDQHFTSVQVFKL